MSPSQPLLLYHAHLCHTNNNGVSNRNKHTKLIFMQQKTVNIALIAGIAGGVLGLLVLLTTCCLLWCLCPLITGVSAC